MGREVEIPRTPPGGAAVPDGTVLDIFRLTNLVTPVASPTVTGGIVNHQYDGSYGPIEQRMTYAGETRKRDSRVRGQFGPLSGGEVSSILAALGPGVVRGIRNDLAVVSGAPGRTVYVRSGVEQAAGIIYSQYTDNLVSPTFGTNVSGNTRIDLIGVLHYTPGHAEEGRSELSILAGTPAASPVAPTPTQDYENGTWFEPLAQVTLASGYSSISAGNIVDVRRSVTPSQPVSVSFLSSVAGTTITNIPLAETEFGGGTTPLIRVVSLDRATQFRLGGVQLISNGAGKIRMKYWTGAAWADLAEAAAGGDASFLPVAPAPATFNGAWVSIAAGARKVSALLKLYTVGGDGVADPIINAVTLEAR